MGRLLLATDLRSAKKCARFRLFLLLLTASTAGSL